MKSQSGSFWMATGLHRYGERKSQWVQNVQKTPQVKLSIAGENVRRHSPVPHRSHRARTRHDCHSAEVLDVPAIIELGRFLAAIGLMRDKTGSFEVLFGWLGPPHPVETIRRHAAQFGDESLPT